MPTGLVPLPQGQVALNLLFKTQVIGKYAIFLVEYSRCCAEG